MNKIMKKVLIMSLAIITSTIYVSTKERKQNIGDAVQVMSLPIAGKTIVLDAGHGTPDEGDCLLTLIDNN